MQGISWFHKTGNPNRFLSSEKLATVEQLPGKVKDVDTGSKKWCNAKNIDSDEIKALL